MKNKFIKIQDSVCFPNLIGGPRNGLDITQELQSGEVNPVIGVTIELINLDTGGKKNIFYGPYSIEFGDNEVIFLCCEEPTIEMLTEALSNG